MRRPGSPLSEGLPMNPYKMSCGFVEVIHVDSLKRADSLRQRITWYAEGKDRPLLMPSSVKAIWKRLICGWKRQSKAIGELLLSIRLVISSV